MGIHGIASGQGQHGLGHAFGRLEQALTGRILAQEGKYALIMFFQFFQMGRCDFFFMQHDYFIFRGQGNQEAG